ncbi:hypothetical protein [Aestuariibaculum suncheonense]|nr:hypothetical protein [Aestuariibaculum suncheonense]
MKISDLNEFSKRNLIESGKIFNVKEKIYTDESQIPENEKNEFHREFEIESFLPKSGFLSFNENFIRADGGSHYDLCYWNTSKDYKLVAFRYFEFGSESYDELEFFILKNNKIVEIDSKNILPKLELEDLVDIKAIEKDGLDKVELLRIFQKVTELEFILPKKGKNIIVDSFEKDVELNGQEFDSFQKFRKYFKKNIVLIWNDGYFELDK